MKLKHCFSEQNLNWGQNDGGAVDRRGVNHKRVHNIGELQVCLQMSGGGPAGRSGTRAEALGSFNPLPPLPCWAGHTRNLTQAGDIGPATGGCHNALGGTPRDVVINLSS